MLSEGINASMLYNTVRHLRWEQVVYRIWYFLRNRIAPPVYRPEKLRGSIRPYTCELAPLPFKSGIYPDKQCFEFLNIRHCFKEQIDWNFNAFGKLWTYNLNYFEFINEQGIDAKEGRDLIRNFIESLEPGHTGLESYPLSLRGINLIKYLIVNKISESPFLESLYGQYKLLHRNIEYHLLGNHLLENALSLYTGGIFFDDRQLIKTGIDILERELDEQILTDGAHFERSPMYHQLILERMLDVINILSALNCPGNNQDISGLLREKAGKMLGWLICMTFDDGTVPHFNDSAPGISLETNILNYYAAGLNVSAVDTFLSDSGYRRYKTKNYDIIIDAGDIGPDYQPGHSHSDTFSFVLFIKGNPVIVDTGVSTYETGKKRLSEKQTSAHNTFQLKGAEQTEVWSSFRVGRRAYCSIIKETEDNLTARHNGYSHSGIESERSYNFRESEILISDYIANSPADSYLHFYPGIDINLSGNRLESELFCIEFEDNDSMENRTYDYSEGFNSLKSAGMIAFGFHNSMNFRIIIK